MNATTATPKEAYLGDGLYAAYDGFSLWLRGPRQHGDHFVALEPLAMIELLRFLQDTPMPSAAWPPYRCCGPARPGLSCARRRQAVLNYLGSFPCDSVT
jgi:hypothetical protein